MRIAMSALVVTVVFSDFSFWMMKFLTAIPFIFTSPTAFSVATFSPSCYTSNSAGFNSCIQATSPHFTLVLLLSLLSCIIQSVGNSLWISPTASTCIVPPTTATSVILPTAASSILYGTCVSVIILATFTCKFATWTWTAASTWNEKSRLPLSQSIQSNDN